MKYLLIIVSLLLTSGAAYAQENQTLSKKEERALAKEKRKAEQAKVDEEQKEITDLMLEYQRFVLEADYVSNKTGNRSPVNSNLNFVIVDSTEATLQLSSPWGAGLNGLGGITVEGKVTKYEVKKREKKRGTTYTATMFIMSTLGTFDITMFVSENGRADATVRGNTSGSLTYSGQLVPLSQSRVYKGTSYP